MVKLCRDLWADPPKDYFAASKQLAKMSADELIPGLRKALRDDKLRDKVLRFFARGYVKDKRILPDVVEIVKKHSGKPRFYAARLFRFVPDKRTVPILIKYCLDDNYSEGRVSRSERSGLQSTFRSLLYETALTLKKLTDGRTGDVKIRGGGGDPPSGEEDFQKIRELRERIKKWWEDNGEAFLEELKKEYGTTGFDNTEEKKPQGK